MRALKTAILVLGALGVLVAAGKAAQGKSGPGNDGSPAGQSAADALRAAAGTDGGFLAAKHLKPTYDAKDLATAMQYPTDAIVVVRLKGSDVRAAFERSVSLYPQSNTSFLQISGFTVEISASGSPESRVLNVNTDNGSALDENKMYEIAMPASLGRGGMGYFKIWDKNKIVRTLEGATLESVLRGKAESASSSRWRVRP